MIAVQKCTLGDIDITDAHGLDLGTKRAKASNGQIGQVGWNLEDIVVVRVLGSAPGADQRTVSQKLSMLAAGDYFQLDIVLTDPGDGNAVVHTIRADRASLKDRSLDLRNGELTDTLVIAVAGTMTVDDATFHLPCVKPAAE